MGSHKICFLHSRVSLYLSEQQNFGTKRSIVLIDLSHKINKVHLRKILTVLLFVSFQCSLKKKTFLIIGCWVSDYASVYENKMSVPS